MNMRYSDVKRSKQVRFLRVLMVIVLFAGLFVQITMIARISGENKRVSDLNDQITALSYRADNLTRDIASYCNSDEIKQLALKLGMQEPDKSQLRYINVPGLETDSTSAQDAAKNGGQKENN